MLVVGIIEIVAGIVVAMRPRFGGTWSQPGWGASF